MSVILEAPEDIKLLKDTHLKGVTLPTIYKDFKFAFLKGNEDAPEYVELYMSSPLEASVEDDFLAINFMDDGLIYCEMFICNGELSEYLASITVKRRVEALK